MSTAWPGSRSSLAADGPRLSPPEVVVAIKALACELPATTGVPLARWHCPDLARAAIDQGITASISDTTIWRWLSADALKPWRKRSWIFPRDPNFAARAAPVLDLYHRRYNNRPLGSRDYVLSADEKTGLQALSRIHPATPPRPGSPMRIEHEYVRKGTLAYLAAWDVHRAKLFGRCEDTTGIDPFLRLVEQIMNAQPYASADNVYLIVDNGSSHRGQASTDRVHVRWPNAHLVHLPVHASWLNQIEIYFSILTRKLLTPTDFADLDTLAERVLAFQDHYEQIASPFEWKFTRDDLHRVLARTTTPTSAQTQAA
jgi:hypothetical protein